jgi:hypothetical protein
MKVLYQDAGAQIALPGLAITSHSVTPDEIELDLIVTFAAQQDSLQVLVKYDVDLYRDDTVRTFVAQIESVMTRCLLEPATDITELVVHATDVALRRQAESARASSEALGRMRASLGTPPKRSRKSRQPAVVGESKS